MIRAVIDTNVLVSALLSPHGKEALIPLAVRRGLFRPCLAADVFAEYVEVLNRRKFGFDRDEIDATLAMFRDHAEHAATETLAAYGALGLPDPDDEPFLACALALGAGYIVTGNKRHFPPETCRGVRIANARELLDLLAEDL